MPSNQPDAAAERELAIYIASLGLLNLLIEAGASDTAKIVAVAMQAFMDGESGSERTARLKVVADAIEGEAVLAAVDWAEGPVH